MTTSERSDSTLLRLGVSSCLLGNEVRYDGAHRRDRFVSDQLGEYVEWVPVCPELEAGMGVPRPPVRLVRRDGELRMIEVRSGRDHTTRMRRFAVRRVRSLELSGYVVKKGSPSCGASRVEIQGAGRATRREGVGLYTAALREAYPHLPVEDEERLHDARLRENFIVRVFAYQRLREMFRPRWSRRRVVEFHRREELLLISHSPVANRELGRLVESFESLGRPELRDRYSSAFMQALERVSNRDRRAKALQHAARHFEKQLDSGSRSELASSIHDYREGLLPLLVPITLIRHHARRLGVGRLEGQTFLEPHPWESMLCNHV